MKVMRVFIGLLALASALWAQKDPFTADAMMKLLRISEPQISPDGKMVAFTVDTVDMDKNIKPKSIYVVPVNGGAAIKITSEGTQNLRPRWTPDSKRIVFVSNRAGSSQIWMMNPDGTEPKQISSLSTEASDALVSPDGSRLVFTSDVYPDCPDDACNKAKLDAENASKMKARSYTSLLYRHWRDFQFKRRKHILSMAIEG